MLTTNEINILGNIVNTTWGVASTDAGSFPVGTTPLNSIKCQLTTSAENDLNSTDEIASHQLVMTYLDFVTFSSQYEVEPLRRKLRDIAIKACAAKLALLKKEFRGSAERSLKIKELKTFDSVEFTNMPSPAVSLIGAPRQAGNYSRGYYRYTVIYTVK